MQSPMQMLGGQGMANITIKEAAESLGVSVDTVRRRIKDNKIRAWKIEGQYGKQWVIDPDSLAEFQQVIDVVPVKTELDLGVLMDSIRSTVLEATKEAARLGTLEAMQEHNEELEELRNEVKALRKLIEQQQEDKEILTLGQKIKGIFKKR